MPSNEIATIVQLIENLPEAAQRQVNDHLREYLEDLRDEAIWNDAFAKTQPQLAEATRRAKREIAEGEAEPLELEQL